MAITVANGTRDTVYFDFCRSFLERQEEGQWESVGGILCNLVGSVNPLHGMIPIPPGSSRETLLHFHPFTGMSLELSRNHQVRVVVNAGLPVSWWAHVGRLSFQSITTNEFIPAPS